jgi:hypothetical protein
MIFEAVSGPCPFSLGDNNIAYSVPRTGSLIDSSITDLLRGRGSWETIGTSMIMAITTCIIPSVVAGDHTYETIDSTDAQVVLWNFLTT